MKRGESYFYTITRAVSRSYYEGIHKAEFFGLENIPKSGAFIIASNHASFLDPPLVGHRVPRQIYYFARRTLMKNALVSLMLPHLNTILVDRDSADIGALKKVFSVLKKGHGLLFFPEGTRTKDGNLQIFKEGVGMVACRSQATVIPTKLFGTYKTFSRYHSVPDFDSRLKVVYGKPIPYDEYEPGKNTENRYAMASNIIYQKVKEIEDPNLEIL